MTRYQKILAVSAVVVLPFSLYAGPMLAWLFGHFFPGLNESNASPSALLLWKGGAIFATLAVSALLLSFLVDLGWTLFRR